MTRTPASAMTLIALAVLLPMALWFGVSASAPAIQSEWSLTPGEVSALTLAVQLGFVAGTLVSALTNLSDLVSPPRLIFGSAVLGAAANAMLAATVDSIGPAVAIRFATGFFLAGVYPPGMKMMAGWFAHRRGLALGILVGALTLGKAIPYLINAAGSASWRVNVLTMSLAAAIGAALVLAVPVGPHAAPSPPFDIHQASAIFRSRPLRLASFGYYGHMWELYAMWTWIPALLRASASRGGLSPTLAEAGAFIVIGSGAAGCIAAGALADRAGRTTVASAAMIVSGACCIVAGLAFDQPLLLLLVCAIWGATVVADSAQFSACTTELADRRYVGTALTMQTCIGFLLTTVSIHLLPLIAERVGWQWAFAVLAPGPIAGTVAMWRLRNLPEAALLAGGRR